MALAYPVARFSLRRLVQMGGGDPASRGVGRAAPFASPEEAGGPVAFADAEPARVVRAKRRKARLETKPH
ncbi:unnamed protein product, partial [Iphiclides podalirius]